MIQSVEERAGPYLISDSGDDSEVISRDWLIIYCYSILISPLVVSSSVAGPMTCRMHVIPTSSCLNEYIHDIN